MTVPSKPIPDVPAETKAAVRKIFNSQYIYLRIGDQIQELAKQVEIELLAHGSIYSGTTALRMALVATFQYAELLADPQAAEATRRRIDWKYALYLPVHYPGISANHLCEFRQYLYSSLKGMEVFGQLLKPLSEAGLFTRAESNGLTAKDLLSTVCTLNRLYKLNQLMTAVLSMLAATDPDWLRANARPYWFERYRNNGLGFESVGLSTARLVEAGEALGRDSQILLDMLQQHRPTALEGQVEIHSLERFWKEQFVRSSNGVRWRIRGCANCTCNLLEPRTG